MPSAEKLAEFVAWCHKHITGDEKGQAQIFLDRLFQAFSQKGCLDVGGTTEFRIRKSNEDGGGTSFADYVWKPIVLCNFDEFQVYDFATPLDTPDDTVKLTELPDRWPPFAFLFPTNEKPIFD